MTDPIPKLRPAVPEAEFKPGGRGLAVLPAITAEHCLYLAERPGHYRAVLAQKQLGLAATPTVLRMVQVDTSEDSEHEQLEGFPILLLPNGEAICTCPDSRYQGERRGGCRHAEGDDEDEGPRPFPDVPPPCHDDDAPEFIGTPKEARAYLTKMLLHRSSEDAHGAADCVERIFPKGAPKDLQQLVDAWFNDELPNDRLLPELLNRLG